MGNSYVKRWLTGLLLAAVIFVIIVIGSPMAWLPLLLIHIGWSLGIQ